VQTLDRTDPGTLVEALRAVLAGRVPSVEANDGATPAAVLVPLHHHSGDWHVILNVRSNQVGQHKGEVAFPGGRLEAEDQDMTACALRETWEEMGIVPEDVDVLGPLNARLTRTNFLVWPTVGIVPYPYEFKPDAREVAKVIELPLSALLDGSAVRHEARLGPDGTVSRRIAYGYGDDLVFGATAWILEELLDVINEIEWGARA
jgi:8-oxo-dGTP pyrophosphatase MutT (NUDIX family)